MSSHGEIRAMGRSSSTCLKTSRLQMRCIQVVPHLAGVVITMSPGRKAKSSQRALSLPRQRYTFRGRDMRALQG